MVAGLVAWSPWRAPAPRPPVMEFDVELSPKPLFSGYGSAAVLSRQGDRIAFVPEGEDRLMYVRDLSDPTPREIAGTELAYHQFFSPSGDWIAFFTRSELEEGLDPRRRAARPRAGRPQPRRHMDRRGHHRLCAQTATVRS